MNGFIAVHVGAGNHNDNLWPTYKTTCKNACTKALELLAKGCDSTTGVAAAVEVLEDCPTTNAGIGSSISLERTIECDASIMDGFSLDFGSVGAMPLVKNPVQVARRIVEGQAKGLSFNRVPPCTLVGGGATFWASKQGFDTQANLATEEAQQSYYRYLTLMKREEAETLRLYLEYQSAKDKEAKSVVQEYNGDLVQDPPTSSPVLTDSDSVELGTPPAKRLKASEVVAFSEDANLDTELLRVAGKPSEAEALDPGAQEGEAKPANPDPGPPYPEYILLDTVGAVCVDFRGNVSSAVSSGGIVLKSSGRVGQAGVYGAGCWAQNSTIKSKPNIGTSVTGVGEYLMKTLFAKECYHALYDATNNISALSDALRYRFMASPFLKRVTSSKLAGVLAVQYFAEDNRCLVSWAHNTNSMILGYGSTSGKRTAEVVSVLPEGATAGGCIVGGERCVRFISGA